MILDDYDTEKYSFQITNESALREWLTPEEDEAWKNL
jgi:hypothetical protein